MSVNCIGLLFETREDALRQGDADPAVAYHWREGEEIDAIEGAIGKLGYSVVRLGAPESLVRNPGKLDAVDFVFNLSVGFSTRFRTARGPMLLELLGKPYTGADPYARMVSQNKQLMKAFWDKAGFPTPPWIYVHDPQSLDHSPIPGFPCFVKPAYEGSSVGIDDRSLCHDIGEVKSQVSAVWDRLRIPLIIEKFIAGREFKVGIVGNIPPKFIGVIEDVDRDGSALGKKYLGFNDKYHARFSKRAVPDGDPLITRIRADAKAMHRLFVPVDYATADLRVDDAGNHWFLEFNADATLHPARTLAQCCFLHGRSYTELFCAILEASFERWGLMRELS